MKCVHTLRTGRHKREADITLLFQYIYGPKPFLILVWLKHKVIWAKICVIQSRSYGDGSSDPREMVQLNLEVHSTLTTNKNGRPSPDFTIKTCNNPYRY